jgi:hypothetical protein
MTPLQMLLLDETDSDSDLELLCMMMGPRKIPRRLRDHSNPFDREDDDFLEKFHFDKAGVLRLCAALAVPVQFKTEHGSSCPGTVAMCFLLFRYKIGTSYRASCAEFGVSYGFLSEATKSIERWLFKQAANKLNTFNPVLCTRERLTRYARVITKYGCPVPNVCAVIDGTKFAIAKPGGDVANDIATYSGKHPSQNCLGYQALITPDGLFLHLFGPLEGQLCVRLEHINNDSVVSVQ